MKQKSLPNRLSHGETIALGFLMIILTGTLLLMLPASSRDGMWTSFSDCLFTATSATCVTGLVVVDTYTHWSLFGQIVIILMIQIGGLGFMTIGVLFTMFVHRSKRISFRTRGMLSESLNTLYVGGILKLLKKIFLGTLIIEGLGAVLLSFRFCRQLGLLKGIYYGIWHSISAFCNAGFDLMGYQGEYISLGNYAGDWLVILTISTLIILGGIGFLVWDDVTKKKLHFHSYRLHTKIVLIMTGILLIGGTILFLIFEQNSPISKEPKSTYFLLCLFDSVTPRTAGFGTCDLAQLSQAGKFLTIILMYIGGSSGSTAGGVKTSTIAVFFLYFIANIRRSRGVSICHKRLEENALKRAGAVACMNLTLAMAGILVICGVQPALDLRDVALEAFSAISTVGMSTGITRELNQISRVAIIALMYLGRVGGVSILFSLTEMKKEAPYTYPEEKILIG